MKKKGLIKQQQCNKLIENSGISIVKGVDFLSVDIQPEYENSFTFDIHSFTKFLNKNYNILTKYTY